MDMGKVYIAGAGPGDIGLCTVKTMELIKKVDVIVYDRLASKELLQSAAKTCIMVYAGKMPNRHTLNQDEINDELIKFAKEGKTVLRLKGGDPFIFGRGGEEAEALLAESIPYEIIPGVSSFYSACAYAGIPVTHRDFASSIHVITGHFKDEKQLDFENIANMEGTLIFLMAMKNLDIIVNRLIEFGKNAATPVAIIQWGTTSRQREVFGTLGNICKTVEEAKIGHPAIVVMGEVVSVGKKINWQNTRPLWGKRILITRSQEKSGELYAILKDHGAEVWELPVMKISKKAEELISVMPHIADYKWVFFTSANGVDSFFDVLNNINLDARSLHGIKFFAIGYATAAELRKHGIVADFVSQKGESKFAVPELQHILKKNDRILFPVSEIANNILEKEALRLGADVKVVIAYENNMNTKCDMSIVKKIKDGYFNAVAIASSSQGKYLALLTDGCVNAKIFAIGEATADGARKFGLNVYKISEKPSLKSLGEAIVCMLANENV